MPLERGADCGTGRGEIESAVRNLLLDQAAANAVAALALAGVPSILLKGPSIASWLYGSEHRGYTDVDLLVSPASREQAVKVLDRLGYVHLLAGADPSEYGMFEIELVRADGACIDLHHSLIGVRVPPARCWEILSGHVVDMRIAGQSVPVLDPVARTLHLALHLAQNGPRDTKALHDLERGAAQLPLFLWQDALALAQTLGALDAFAGGLTASSQAVGLRERLGVREPQDLEVLLRIAAVPQDVLQVHRLVQATSRAQRAQLLARKVWPTRVYMHTRYPVARRGGGALLHARLARMVALPLRAARALTHWRRARLIRPGTVTPHELITEGDAL